ncbi:3-oxoacyl-[acyl-carrier-protein] synthase 3 [Labeo rohita]|uniref:3-oxoacyl-[acyl-carrier-protein] synthase 3 n=1 Tax=Labeo rohita TaxID=84645 RepID=A0ABQ8LRS5_LABRO|nr:3-oxoacyl-[acyl-carrier-protein] synthase 3 [Labeo rohita]
METENSLFLSPPKERKKNALERDEKTSYRSVQRILIWFVNEAALQRRRVAGKRVLCCKKLMCAVDVLVSGVSQCHYDIIIIITGSPRVDFPVSSARQLDILHDAINHTGLLRKTLVQRGRGDCVLVREAPSSSSSSR